MKKIYSTPESRFVNINFSGSLLNPPIEHSESNESRVWDEDSDRLPTAKSVWGDEEEEVQ